MLTNLPAVAEFAFKKRIRMGKKRPTVMVWLWISVGISVTLP